jgi:methionyl aminopeptidase
MTVAPGRISPVRPVPADIERPEYVGRPQPTPYLGPEVKDAETIAAMRVAGRIAAQALQEVGRNVRPGVTTDRLDAIGHEFLCDHGAYPSTLGYRGFPKSLCTSLNEVICHGIPDSTVVADGDIVNIDITAFIGGVHGDTNATFLAGEVDEQSRLLVERTEQATQTLRLRGGARLHRSRHRHIIPLRADRAPLRRSDCGLGAGNGHDLHH